MTYARGISLGMALAFLTACSDTPSPLSPDRAPQAALEESNALLQRYVAIGTSVSMGWQSDGLTAASQYDSWPAQFTRMSGVAFTQPYVSGTGCRAPLAAPLASGLRISGEPAGAPAASLACAPLQGGITLPTQNVAINGATTFNALNSTPESFADPFTPKLYGLVLPPGTTQLRAAMQQKPRVVSVELGANEVLPARSGIAIPGTTITPFAAWAPLYDALVDTVQQVAPRVVLVGLISDVATFPGFRRGAEIYADAAMLLGAFHVQVAADCDANQNLVFVPVRIPTAVATGIGRRNAGLSPTVLSCADGGSGVQDFILTPAEAGVVNAALGQMNAHIRAVADRHKLAHFALETLYGMPGLKPPFSSVQLMTSAQPYGSLISLDGIHPSGAGHAILASAAARALNARYNMRLPEASAFIAGR